MRRQIVASGRAGESIERIAERLLDIDRPVVELPRHIRQLRDAATFPTGPGDRNLFEEAVDRWADRVRRLGEGLPGGRLRPGPLSMRSATEQLVAELRAARPDQVGHLVDRWVLDRARYQARVVARNETVEAYRDAYRQSTDDKPYVRGYRWVLSNRHPRPDVCDVLANQNLHGLGPGGYPASEVPATPHPLDLCSQVAIIDSAHFRRQLARARGEAEPPAPWVDGDLETGQEWVRRQSAERRHALIGPTRDALLQRGRQVLRPDGTPIPVWELEGRPRPVVRRGPRVPAARLVVADRDSMPQPFPPAPTLPED